KTLSVDTAATCTEAGVGHYLCDMCGQPGEEEVVIAATGHVYDENGVIVKPATCIKKGTERVTCVKCGETKDLDIPMIPHNFVAGEKVAATCEHSAYTPYTCSTEGCTESYNKYDAEPTPAHKYESFAFDHGTLTSTCKNCGKELVIENIEDGHEYENITITKAPTCTEEGAAIISCADGAEIEVTLPIDETAHTKLETTYTAPECNKEGSIVTECKTCGAEIVNETINALEHKYVTVVDREATCTEVGSQHEECAVCGDAKAATEINKKPHSYVRIEGDCTSDTLDVCACGDKVIVKAQPGHTMSDWTTYQAATCFSNEVQTRSCQNEGCTHLEAQIVENSKLTHLADATKDVVTAPTCLTGGFTTHICQYCKTSFIDTFTDPLDHNSTSEKYVAPTCEEGGKTVVICNHCGKIMSETPDGTAKREHSFPTDGTGKVTVAATCTKDGEMVVKCKYDDCEETQTVTIKALGHEWVKDDENSTAATCENDAVNAFYCLRCGETKTETVKDSALGHNMVPTEEGTVAATCKNGGTTHLVCANDGCGHEETKTTPVDENAHDYGEGELHQSCYEASYRLYTCKNDASHTKKEYTADSLLDHKLEVEVGADGKSVRIYCKNEGCPIDETNEVSNEHRFEVEKVVNATCQKDGYIELKCKTHENCSENQTITLSKSDAAQHTNLRTSSSGVCGDGGIVYIICKDCGKTVDSWKPEAHEWHEPTVVAPTCTQNGYTEHHCKYCPAIIKDNYKMAQGHQYPKEGELLPATCTTPARWAYKCVLCNKDTHKADGSCACDHGIDYIKYVNDQNSKPNGHVWGDWQYEDHGSYFYKYRQCENCSLKEYEVDENQNKTVYHQVKFVNPYSTVDYRDVSSKQANELAKLNQQKLDKAAQLRAEKTEKIAAVKAEYNEKYAPVQEKYDNDLADAKAAFKEAVFRARDDAAEVERIEAAYDAQVAELKKAHEIVVAQFDADYEAAVKAINEKYDGVFDEEGNKTAPGLIDNLNSEYEAKNAQVVAKYNDEIAKIEVQYDILNGGKTYLVKKDASVYDNEVVGVAYAKNGTSATYVGSNPTRAKDYNFGAYVFEGWAATKDGKVISRTTIDKVTENTTVYATFKGETVTYTVTFYNQTIYGSKGARITQPATYTHGDPACFIVGKDKFKTEPWNTQQLIEQGVVPTLPSTIANNFEFTGWSWEGGSGASYDTQHIYDSVDLTAVYDVVGKQYKVVLHDYARNAKGEYKSDFGGEAIKEFIFNHGDAYDPSIESLVEKEPFDGNFKYLLSFEGWKLANGSRVDYTYTGYQAPDSSWAPYEYKEGNETNENLKTDKEKGIIHLYPSYYKRPVTYKLTVSAIDIGDVGVPVGSLVEVFDVKTGKVYTGTIDKNSQCVFNLVEGRYRVVVHSGDDAGFSGGDEKWDFDLYKNMEIVVEVQASKDINDGKENCSCICHSFLGRIWITFLNLIYRLFGKRTVCCYDMYATHADRLVYGPGENK
ncbi:MAG: hypothetical protein NC110_01675, partial [Ruminococcus sp.]|nr:hypothetical protein [Ruminococcus sp.]